MKGREPRVAFTFDLHPGEHPEDVVHTASWFAERGLPATFFLPSCLLGDGPLRAALRELPRLGHEVGSHGHLHDWDEIERLVSGSARDLAFLERSRDLHAECFGTAPLSFRSPRWCTLGRAAVAELSRLGYRADSSATPQRLPWLSSAPLRLGWWRTSRRVHALAEGLWEVPTSTLIVPAGSPTFLTLRSAGTAMLLSALQLEQRWTADRVLVVQLHVEDFAPDSSRPRSWGRLGWRDLWPRKHGGPRLKLFLRETNPVRILALHHDIVRRLGGSRAIPIRAAVPDPPPGAGAGDGTASGAGDWPHPPGASLSS